MLWVEMLRGDFLGDGGELLGRHCSVGVGLEDVETDWYSCLRARWMIHRSGYLCIGMDTGMNTGIGHWD